MSKGCADAALGQRPMRRGGSPFREAMTDLMKCADFAMRNEEDAEKVFVINAGKVDPQVFRIVADKHVLDGTALLHSLHRGSNGRWGRLFSHS
jgi:hypothetical protein